VWYIDDTSFHIDGCTTRWTSGLDFQNGIIIVLEHIEQIEVQIATKKNQRGAAATFNMLFAWAVGTFGWQALPYLLVRLQAGQSDVFWKMEKQTCPPGSSFLLSTFTLGVNSFATDRYWQTTL
jgi:hypothetical protein